MPNRHERRKRNAQLHKAEIFLTAMTDITKEQQDYFRFRETKGGECIICEQNWTTSPPHSVIEFHAVEVEGSLAAGIVCDACINLPDLYQRFASCVEDSVRIIPISEPGNAIH